MTGVGCHFLLQGIFPTQWSNLHLLHWQWILYHLSHQENSPSYECVTYFTPEGLRRNILSIVEISKPRFCGFCWFVFWSTELYSLRFQFSSVQFMGKTGGRPWTSTKAVKTGSECVKSRTRLHCPHRQQGLSSSPWTFQNNDIPDLITSFWGHHFNNHHLIFCLCRTFYKPKIPLFFR